MEKYERVRALGKGSFGSAILIKRKTDGAPFVVKEVSLAKMSKKERDEARHECEILQKLSHPNIVRYAEHFENRNNLYIVMEYCDGGDIAQKVKQSRGPMKESTIMYYFSQVCLAMEYLHSRHILHRDIKTMNVFLMKNGAVKLGDFGISTVLRSTMGMANTVCGTPYYFSPELCRNRPYNNKSDIWAMGVLLYECATGGRHPFDGNNMNQLMQRIVKGSYSLLPGHYSAELRKLVDWCLQKDPSKRPSIKQTLAYPLVRSSLEQLEENLMLATQCRVRLKDIIDFESATDSNEKAPEKAPASPSQQRQQQQQTGDLSPGQAAALAMARLQQQRPTAPVGVSRPLSLAGALVGPKPAAANERPQNNIHNHNPYYQLGARNNGPPGVAGYAAQRAAAEKKIAGPAPVQAGRGPSAAAAAVDPPPQRNGADTGKIVRRNTNLSAQDDRFGANMNRINAIMAKYGNNVDDKARETIHAYMRRKQEEYQQRQKDEIEKRNRRNDLRQRELKKVIAQQQQQRVSGAGAIDAPRKSKAQPQQQRPQTVAPEEARPSQPQQDPFRKAGARTPTSGLPQHQVANGPAFGHDPRALVGPKPRQRGGSPSSDVVQGNRRRSAQHIPAGRKVAVAANSPRTKLGSAPVAATTSTGAGAAGAAAAAAPSPPPISPTKSNFGASPRSPQADRQAAQRELNEKARALREEAQRLAAVDHRRDGPHAEATALEAPRSAGNPVRGSPAGYGAHARNPLQYGKVGGVLASPGRSPSKLSAAQLQQRPPFSTEPPVNQAPLAVGAAPASDSPSLLVTPYKAGNARSPGCVSSSNLYAKPSALAAVTPKTSMVPNADLRDIRELNVAGVTPTHRGGAPRYPHRQSLAQRPLSPLAPPQASSSREVESPRRLAAELSRRRDSLLPPLSSETGMAQGAVEGHQMKLHPTSRIASPTSAAGAKSAELVDVSYGVAGPRRSPDTNAPPVQDALRLLRQRSAFGGSPRETGAPAQQPLYIPDKHQPGGANLRRYISTDAALYGGMGREGPTRAELEYVQEQKRFKEDEDVVVPNMLETLRGLNPEARQHSSPLALLKQRHSMAPRAHENSSLDQPAPSPVTALSLGDVSNLRCSGEAQVRTGAGQRSSSADGYSEMLQHLRNLLQKRKVQKLSRPSPRSASASLPVSPTLSKGAPSLTSEGATSLVLESPPNLQHTKPLRAYPPSLLQPQDDDDAGDSSHGDHDDDEDDDFEDAVPLSPVRCAEMNDTYVQALREKAAGVPRAFSHGSLHDEGSADDAVMDDDDFSGYYGIPSPRAIMREA